MSTAMAGPNTETQPPGVKLVRVAVREVRLRVWGAPRKWRAALLEPREAGPGGDVCAGNWHHAGDSCHRCCRVVGTVTRGSYEDAITAAVKLARRRGLRVRKDRISEQSVRTRQPANDHAEATRRDDDE